MTAQRVVSLVPSITPVLARIRPEAVVGVTDRCAVPKDLDTTRVRGPRNPDLAAIRSLRPDVVIASRHSNRELDIQVLRASGVWVWVFDADARRSVQEHADQLVRIVLGWQQPAVQDA